MKKRQFKKAARKAWKLIQEQRSAVLTWREAQALRAYARAFPNRVVKNWLLLKVDGKPKTFYYTPPESGPPVPTPEWTAGTPVNVHVRAEADAMMTKDEHDAMMEEQEAAQQG